MRGLSPPSFKVGGGGLSLPAPPISLPMLLAQLMHKSPHIDNIKLSVPYLQVYKICQ